MDKPSLPARLQEQLKTITQQLKVKEIAARNEHNRMMKAFHFLLSLLFASLLVLAVRRIDTPNFFWLPVVALWLWFFGWGAGNLHFKKKQNAAFKGQVFDEMLNTFYPDVRYNKSTVLGTHTLINSVKKANLLKDIYEIKAEDKFQCQQGGKDFSFLEIKVFDAPKRSSDEQVFKKPYFHGLWFEWLLSRKLCSEPIIIIAVSHHYIHSQQSIRAYLDSCHLNHFESKGLRSITDWVENESFKERFVAYSTNLDSVDELVFSPTFLQKLYDWHYLKDIKKPVFLSFFEDRIYAMVPTDKDMFEPVWENNSIHPQTSLEQLYLHITTCCNFAEDIAKL